MPVAPLLRRHARAASLCVAPTRAFARESGMKIHHLTVSDAFASLKSGLAGLSDAEAQRRLVEFGANEVEEVAHEALLLTFAREFVHFFAIIFWIPGGAA